MQCVSPDSTTPETSTTHARRFQSSVNSRLRRDGTSHQLCTAALQKKIYCRQGRTRVSVCFQKNALA